LSPEALNITLKSGNDAKPSLYLAKESSPAGCLIDVMAFIPERDQMSTSRGLIVGKF
jgi:hypothetical protein